MRERFRISFLMGVFISSFFALAPIDRLFAQDETNIEDKSLKDEDLVKRLWESDVSRVNEAIRILSQRHSEIGLREFGKLLDAPEVWRIDFQTHILNQLRLRLIPGSEPVLRK